MLSVLSSTCVVVDMHCVVDSPEKGKRMERRFVAWETSVVWTALPWSMRMMIRLNAMPCSDVTGYLSVR